MVLSCDAHVVCVDCLIIGVYVEELETDQSLVVGHFLSCWNNLQFLTFASTGGGPIFSLVVHQPAFPSIWPAVPSLLSRGDNVVRMRVQLKR